MTVTMSKRIVLSTIFLLLLSYGCRQKAEFYRFIDQIQHENVISSPLVDLEERFEVVEQEWSGREMDLITIDNTTYWAQATKMPVLHWEENQEPENMRVFREGKKMEFASFPQPGLSSWKWMRFGQTIEPFWYKGYKKGDIELAARALSFPFPVDKIEVFDYIQDPFERKHLGETQIEVKNELMKNIRLYLQKKKELESEFGAGAISDENLLEKFRALGYIR